MADPKIFAGPRIRRIRTNLSQTQASMAEALGISPSYLNLIERNQRPLTVQLLMKLASVYQVDINELQGDISGQAVSQLKEIFSDPLLKDEIASDHELVEAADMVPNVASGIIHLYRAYKEISDKLSDLSHLMSADDKVTVASQKRLPIDEVREWIADNPYYFDEADRAAEALHSEIDLSNHSLERLKAHIQDTYSIGVRTLPLHTMETDKIRYDRHSQRIFLSERLTPEEAYWELAMELPLLGRIDAFNALCASQDFENPESNRLLQVEFAKSFAASLILPYEAFLSASERLRYDVQLLARRFNTSIRTVLRRLTSLHRKGQAGLPFFFLELDMLGNPATFLPGADFHHPRTNLCARLLPNAQSDATIITRTVSLQQSNGDINEWFLIIHTESQPSITFEERGSKRTLIAGTRQVHTGNLTYRDAGLQNKTISIGLTCRLCEQQNCQDRLVPPATRPLSLDLHNRSFSPYDFG